MPGQRGNFKTPFITHGITGLGGAIAGLLLFAWLLRGGLIAIWPNHVWHITAVRNALKRNQ